MRSSLALLTLLLIAALSLVAPTGCGGCNVDLHGGQALHVVFEHLHPEAPAEAEGLAVVPGGQPEIHAVAQLAPGGEPAVAGQVLPRGELLSAAVRPESRVFEADELAPAGLRPLLLDPPPRVA